jgi:hypothetical protein
VDRKETSCEVSKAKSEFGKEAKRRTVVEELKEEKSQCLWK